MMTLRQGLAHSVHAATVRPAAFAMIALLVGLAVPAAGQTNTMTAGTTWEGGTWSLGHTPLASEDVVISSGLSVQLSSPASCQSLSIGTASASATSFTVVTGGSLLVSGSLNVNPGNQSSSFTFSAGSGTAIINGSVIVSPIGTNLVRVESGMLNFTNSGTFDWNEGTLTITQSTGQMTFTGPFSLNGGTLQFDQGTTRFDGGFTRWGGTLQSNGNGESIVVGGPLTANSPLTFDPASTVTFTGTTTITPNSAITFGSLKVDMGGTVTLAGSISLASTSPAQANLTIQNGTLDLASYSADRTTLGGTVTLGNNSLLKIGGSGTFPDNYQTHSINANSEVQYAGSSQVGGLFPPAKYGNLTITGSNVGSSEIVAVAGTLTVGNGAQFSSTTGTVNMSGGSSIANPSGTLVFNELSITGSGTVDAAGGFSVGGTLLVSSGVTLSASGTTTLLDGANMSNSGTLDLAGLTIEDNATASASGGFSVSGALIVGASATFEPSGTVTMKNGSSISHDGTLAFDDLTIATAATVSGTSMRVNGTLMVNAGGSFSPSGTVTFGNGAGIQNTGTLAFSDLAVVSSATVSASGSISVSGTMTIGSGAEFSASGIVTMSAGSAISSSGTLEFDDLTISGNGSVTATGNFSVGSALTVNSLSSFSSSGTLTLLNGASIVNSNSLSLSGLTIPALANVNVDGPVALGGSVSVGGGSTLSANGTWSFAHGSSVTNLGTLSFDGVTVPASASVNIVGGYSLDGMLSVGTGGSLNVSGTVTMQGGSITNSGAIGLNHLTIANGVSILASGGMSVGGQLQVNSGATLDNTSGTVTLESGSSIANSGTLKFTNLDLENGATVTCTGGFTLAGSLSIPSASSLSPSGTVTMTDGSSIANSGTLAFSGLTIPSDATVTSTGSFSISGNVSIGANADFAPSGVVTFNGGSSTFTDLGSNTFGHVTLNKNANGMLTLFNDLTLSGTLSLTAGTISTGGSLVDVTSSSASSVAATNGTVSGRMRRAMANNASTYLFNDAATSITRASGTNPTSVTVESFPNTIVPYGEASEHAKRYYTILATGGSGTWSVALSYRNAVGGNDVDERNSLTESGFLLHQGNGSDWTAVSASTQSIVANPLRSGKVTATLSSFGDIAFGGLVVFSASASSISFGEVGLNRSGIDTVTISNSGSMTLSISSATIDSAEFSVSPFSANISPGGSGDFVVTWAPVTAGPRSGTLVFVSNAPGSPDTVLLSGTALLPSITSFTPASAIAGASVTLTGTFSSTLANNVVHFGGVRGAVTSGSSSQLIVTVPAGATQVPITVTAARLTAASPKAFATVHPDVTTLSTNAFSPYSAFSSLSNTMRVLSADLDNDGRSDLIYVRPSANLMTVLRNTSTPGTLNASSFASGVDITIPSSVSAAATGDFNGDGKIDVCVVTQTSPGAVTVFLNTCSVGSISFSNDHSEAIGELPTAVAVGDIDVDGRTDIVAQYAYYTESYRTGIAVLRNTTVSDTVRFSVNTTGTDLRYNAPHGLAVRDLNLDGKPDILLTAISDPPGAQWGWLSLWLNSSTPGSISLSNWTNLQSFNFNYTLKDIEPADMDGDGYPDIFFAGNSSNFTFYRNNAGSSIGSRQFVTPLSSSTIDGGDLNGDGKPELVVANNTSVSIVPNNSTSGTITLGTWFNLSTGGSTFGSVLADLDGDGRSDIATANGGGGVLRAKTLPASPGSQPSAFAFVGTTDTTISFQWSKGNGDSTIIILRADSAVTGSLSDGLRYTANATYGSGTQTATGQYVVAATSDSTATVYGLQPTTTYYFAAYAFNGGGDQALENYLTTSPATGSVATEAPLPVQMVGMHAEVISGGSAPQRGSGHEVRLSWTTASEIDNLGWEVERRAIYDLRPSTPLGTRLSSVDFQTIGFVEGAGTSTSARAYTFTDHRLFDNRHSPIDNPTRFAYRLKQLDRSGSFSYSHEVEVEIGTVPREFTLSQNYPNPFNPATTITFTVPTDGRVTLKVYDLLGREVATLVDGVVSAGSVQRADFDATSFPSGLYVARLESGSSSLIRKMLLMK